MLFLLYSSTLSRLSVGLAGTSPIATSTTVAVKSCWLARLDRSMLVLEHWIIRTMQIVLGWSNLQSQVLLSMEFNWSSPHSSRRRIKIFLLCILKQDSIEKSSVFNPCISVKQDSNRIENASVFNPVRILFYRYTSLLFTCFAMLDLRLLLLLSLNYQDTFFLLPSKNPPVLLFSRSSLPTTKSPKLDLMSITNASSAFLMQPSPRIIPSWAMEVVSPTTHTIPIVSGSSSHQTIHAPSR